MTPFERQLRFGVIWSERDDLSPLNGIERKVKRVGTRTQFRWGREAVQLLEDSEVVIRTMAIAALDLLPVNGRSVLELLQTQPDLFRGVPAEGVALNPVDLEGALYRRLARDCAPGTRLALRDRIKVQPFLVILMAARDGDWVARHAGRLVPRGYLGGVLNGFTLEQARTAIEAMGPWPDSDEVLAQNWWQHIEHADELRRMIKATSI